MISIAASKLTNNRYKQAKNNEHSQEYVKNALKTLHLSYYLTAMWTVLTPYIFHIQI